MNCLSHLELEKALRESEGDLPDQWDNHLASCASCRNRLEEFAGSEAEWQSACRALSEISTGGSENDPGWHDGDHAESNIETHSVQNYQSTILYRLDCASTEPAPLSVASESEIELDAPSHPENLGRVGRYEIERSIGRGGMGIVFKGFDAELNRPVAIKVLSPHLAGHGTARQRFTREAKAAAAVVHDNVVPIFDIHSDTKQPYLVMPFVTGVSLQDHVDKQGQLGTENILQVAVQIASGLAAAHAQGLIHRDIKPANILLENGLNRVQITDFGLARAVDDAAMTYSGMIAGTPHYMSPEQAKGDALDHRSDLFSLGCVMYFMATGRTLHRGDGPFSVISQLCRGNYIPVREINPKIPRFVSDIIDKLLENQVQHRFQSAAQLAQHLEQSLAHLQHPTGKKAPRMIWSSRKKKKLSRISIATISLVTLVSFAFFILPLLWRGGSQPNNKIGSTDQDNAMDVSPILTPMSDVERELSDIEQNLRGLEMNLAALESSELAANEIWGDSLQVELSELESQLNLENGPLFPSQPDTGANSVKQKTTNQNGSTLNPNGEIPNEENEDQP